MEINQFLLDNDISWEFQNNASNPNIHIYNSYLVTDEKTMSDILDLIMSDPLYSEVKRTRTKQSYITEWKAHNNLYYQGIEVERTKDVDLDENEKRGCLFALFSMTFRALKKSGIKRNKL